MNITKIKYIYLPLTAILLLFSFHFVSAETVEPTDDLTVQCGADSGWLGSCTLGTCSAQDVRDTTDYMFVWDGNWNVFKSFLYFDLSAFDDKVITSATLHLYYNPTWEQSPSQMIHVQYSSSALPFVYADDWLSQTETQIGERTINNGTDHYDYDIELDLTDINNDVDKVFALTLTGDDCYDEAETNTQTQMLAFYTIDSSYEPYLEFTYSDPEPEPESEPENGITVIDTTNCTTINRTALGIRRQNIAQSLVSLQGTSLQQLQLTYQNYGFTTIPELTLRICQGEILSDTDWDCMFNCSCPDFQLMTEQTVIAPANNTWETHNFTFTQPVYISDPNYFFTFTTSDYLDQSPKDIRIKACTTDEIDGNLYGQSGLTHSSNPEDLYFIATSTGVELAQGEDDYNLLFDFTYRCSPNSTCILPYKYNEKYYTSTSTLYVYNASNTPINSFSIIDDVPQNLGLKSNGQSYFTYSTNASTTFVTLYVTARDKYGVISRVYPIKILQSTIGFLDILGNRIEQQALENSSVMLSLTGTTTHALVCTPEEWLSGNWWTVSKCNILKSIFDVGDLLSRIGSQIMTKAYVAVSNIFPFNLPIGFSNSWVDAKDKSLPANLSFLDNYVDSNGTLSFAVPATMANNSTVVPVISATSFNDSSETNAFFGFTYAISTYIVYGLFIFNLYGLGVSLYSSLYHNED